MLYSKCPSCNTKLAHKQIPLEDGLQNICNDTKLTDKQKEDAVFDLLKKLEINNYCCRTRVLTYLDEVKLLK